MITNVFMRTLYEDVYSKASRYMSTEVAHAATTAALYAVSNIIAMPLALYATGSTRISTEYINWIMGETPLVAALGFAVGPHGVRIQSSF